MPPPHETHPACSMRHARSLQKGQTRKRCRSGCTGAVFRYESFCFRSSLQQSPHHMPGRSDLSRQMSAYCSSGAEKRDGLPKRHKVLSQTSFFSGTYYRVLTKHPRSGSIKKPEAAAKTGTSVHRSSRKGRVLQETQDSVSSFARGTSFYNPAFAPRSKRKGAMPCNR